MNNKYFLLLFFLFNIYSFSQENKYCVLGYTDKKMPVVLKDIEKSFQVKFSYSSDLLENISITLKKEKRTLDAILFEISAMTNLEFNKLNATYFYITKRIVENLDEVVIENYLTKGITKNNDTSYEISPKKIGLLAGLTEADVLETVQQLPGVVSISETATQLNVRGGRPDQNQIIWDNIPIYHGGHLFGMVSVFNPNVAEKILFYNKATNVRFGDRISSVIDIKTTSKIPKKMNLEVGMNGINADLFANIPIIKDTLSAQISIRRSYEDLYESATFKKFEAKAFQNTNIDDEFFYFKDYNLKINFKPNAKNLHSFSYIHIDNDLENDSHKENASFKDVLGSENEGYNYYWKHNWHTKTKLNTSISVSKYRFDYFNIKNENENFVSKFTKENYITDVSFFTEIERQLNNAIMHVGYQFSEKNTRFLFQEEKDILYVLDKDNSTINTHAIYGNCLFKAKNNFDFNLGLRTNYYPKFDAIRLEPRVIVTKSIKNLKLQFTGEIKDQIISKIDETVLSDLALDNKLWRLADGKNFPIINAKHLSLGGTYIKNNWTFDLDFYHKTVKGISALSLGFLNPLDNQFHVGKQKINGIDFYVKKRFHKFKTWISYSFLDVKNKYEGLNNNTYFRANTDITHVLTSTTNYENKGWNIALSWRIRSGKPVTDLDYTDDGNAYFQGINTERHPIYHRLDLSTVYNFNFSEKIKAKAGMSIKNVYNNKNHIDTNFYGNNAINDPIKIATIHAIGITPNFMFRVYF